MWPRCVVNINECKRDPTVFGFAQSCTADTQFEFGRSCGLKGRSAVLLFLLTAFDINLFFHSDAGDGLSVVAGNGFSACVAH